jgi:hypothetical protein
MPVSIFRTKILCALLAVGKTKFKDDFVYTPGGPEYVPDTNDTVHRLRMVKLGERSEGAFSDEFERMIEELRAFRDAQHAGAITSLMVPKPRPPRPRKHSAQEAALP